MGKLCSRDEKMPLETAWTFIDAVPQLFVTTLLQEMTPCTSAFERVVLASSSAPAQRQPGQLSSLPV